MTPQSLPDVQPDYIQRAIADGYHFECSCGELYSSVEAATGCRKCMKYTYIGYCTHVIDVRNGKVVWGEEPSEEAQQEAFERHRQDSADILAEQVREEYWAQLDADDDARRIAEDQQRQEEEEDVLWDIQDSYSR